MYNTYLSPAQSVIVTQQAHVARSATPPWASATVSKASVVWNATAVVPTCSSPYKTESAYLATVTSRGLPRCSAGETDSVRVSQEWEGCTVTNVGQTTSTFPPPVASRVTATLRRVWETTACVTVWLVSVSVWRGWWGGGVTRAPHTRLAPT